MKTKQTIMKKTYFRPETTLTIVALQQMIAASSGQALNIEGDSGTTNFIDEDATEDAMSRGNSYWDED